MLLVRFALRIWTYESTGSVTQFALVQYMQSHNRSRRLVQITFFSEMPSILISPFAGAVVDKYSRKKVAVASDLCKRMSFAFCVS